MSADSGWAPVASRPGSFTLRTLTLDDYDAVMALLAATPGVCLRESDSREATARYLNRNPELSVVACVGGVIVGCFMGGHDGRRGYLQHLAVSPAFRRRGIGRALMSECLARMEAAGILKSHVEVLVGNEPAHRFWKSVGWQRRGDTVRYSHVRPDCPNV